MYPQSIHIARSNRIQTDSDPAEFWAGTQARTFYELSIGAGASVYVRMQRPVDIVIRSFKLSVNAGEIRLEIYRGATAAGVWSTNLPVLPKNETAFRPSPLYVPKVTLQAGGTFTGGTLYDVLDILTAGATAQQSTVADEGQSDLGAPKDSVGYYKFTNPGTGTAKGVFSAWWEELPVP